jgi:hypothetical protein
MFAVQAQWRWLVAGVGIGITLDDQHAAIFRILGGLAPIRWYVWQNDYSSESYSAILALEPALIVGADASIDPRARAVWGGLQLRARLAYPLGLCLQVGHAFEGDVWHLSVAIGVMSYD